MVDKIRKRRLRWFGHVERTPNGRKKTTPCGLARARGGRQKQRKTTKNLDGQHQGGLERDEY
jgi:hypothetical protein